MQVQSAFIAAATHGNTYRSILTGGRPETRVCGEREYPRAGWDPEKSVAYWTPRQLLPAWLYLLCPCSRAFLGVTNRSVSGWVLTILIVLTVLLTGSVQAQESGASLRGRVVLDKKSDLDNTQVAAVNVDSGYRRTVDVRSEGAYNFSSLKAGSYRLEVITPDGVKKTDELTLRVGQNAILDLNFAAQQVTQTPTLEEIFVTGQVLKLQQGGEVGLNITPEQIESLPQNSRNFLAFADLAPGVSFERGSDGSTRIQGGAQGGSAVNVFIDGVGQKDYVLRGGISGQDSSQGNPFPQSAIGEYRVITQNYKAEFDQVSSAAVVAVSQSGTNEFHGDIFWDFTDDGLRSETPREKELDEGKVETTDSQFGVSLGGPIIEDSLHFFLAYEGKRNETPVEVTPGEGVTAAELPARYAALLGNFNRDFEQDLFFGKIDFSPTADDLIQFSVKIREEVGTRWDNGPNAPSYSHDINNDETRVLLRYEHQADRWTNEVSLTYEDSAWNPQPDSELASILQTSGKGVILNVGGHPNFQDKGQEGWGIQNDFTWTDFADHTIKTGVKLKWVELNTVQQQPFNPQYFYNTEFDPNGAGAFNDQLPYKLEFGSPLAGIGDGSANSDNFQLGIYIQDDWQITDRLEISYGIRWDYEETPVYLDYETPADVVASLRGWPNIQNTNYDINDFISTGNNRDPFEDAFAPRIGFNFDLLGDGQYTLFGGYGRSYDRTQFDFIARESAAQTFPRNTFLFDTGDPDNPCTDCPVWDPVYLTQAGRDTLLAGADTGGGGREISLLSNELDVPYSDQFSLGVRSFWGEWDGEIGVSRVESRDGFAWLLGNRLEDGSFFAPGAIWGPPFGSPPPGFGNVLLGVNGLETDANSVYLKAGKSYNQESGWGINATYTYTDAEESRKFDEFFSLDYPSLNDYPVLSSAGVSEHRLVATGNIDLPWGFQLSGKFSYESEPFVYGVGRPGDADDQRAPRVIEAADDFRQLDLALVKYFELPDFGLDEARFRIRLDILNVFDTENFATFVGNGTSDDFGEVNDQGIGGNLPRTFKVSVGSSF